VKAEATVVRKLESPDPAVPVGIGVAYDLTARGYVEEEYLLEGVATSFRPTSERSHDGRWTVEPAEEAPFTTRLVVRRPADPTQFSGTVVVEWLNVSYGADISYAWAAVPSDILRQGHAWVGVSAQKAGIDGGGIVEGAHLKKFSPDRYEPLQHPGDAWSFDIFTQAAKVMHPSNASGLLGPLKPTLLVAVGASQSAALLMTYINAVDPHARAFDGFLVLLLPGQGSELTGYQVGPTDDPAETARTQVGARIDRIRDDLRAPVLMLQSETDVALFGSGRADQLDNSRLRLWEVAGTAHADTYFLFCGPHDDGSLTSERMAELIKPTSEAFGIPTGSAINGGPQMHYVAHAALEHLVEWAAGGAPPPIADRLVLTADKTDFVRDRNGNALGGVRTPWVDVPTATFSGLGQTGDLFSFLFGTTTELDPDALHALYPGGRKDYLEQFRAALDRSIAAGFILATDREEITKLATATCRIPEVSP
jgi:hypothetical protein